MGDPVVVGLAGMFGLRTAIDGAGCSLPNELRDPLAPSIGVIIESLPFVIALAREG